MAHVTRLYTLPEGHSKLATAAWNAMEEVEDKALYKVNEKLVFTDDLDYYLEGADKMLFDAFEFSSDEEFEEFLLDMVTEWIDSAKQGDDMMFSALEDQLCLEPD